MATTDSLITRDYLVNKFGAKCKRLFRPTVTDLLTATDSDRKNALLITTNLDYTGNWNIQLSIQGLTFDTDSKSIDCTYNVSHTTSEVKGSMLILGEIEITGSVFYLDSESLKLNILIYFKNSIPRYVLSDLIYITAEDTKDTCNRIESATFINSSEFTVPTTYNYLGDVTDFIEEPSGDPIGEQTTITSLPTKFRILIPNASTGILEYKTIQPSDTVEDIDKVYAAKIADKLNQDITITLTGSINGSATLAALESSVSIPTEIGTLGPTGTYYLVNVKNGIVTNGSTEKPACGVATEDTLGGVKLGHTSTTTLYPLLLDAENKAYIDLSANFLTDPGNWVGTTSDNARMLLKTFTNLSTQDYTYSWGKVLLINSSDSVAGPSCIAAVANGFAIGYNTYANASFSLALGLGTTTYNTAECVVGRYNSNEPSNALFVVGNGSSSSALSDAFKVNLDGTAVALTEVQCGDHKLTEKISLDTVVEDTLLGELSGKTLKEILIALTNK